MRQSKSVANGSTPQTEDHWGSPNKLRSTTLLYIVHCTLYTFHCTLYPPISQHNFPQNFSQYSSTQLFHTFFLHSYLTIFSTQVSNHFFTQLFHTIFQQNYYPNFSNYFLIKFFYPIFSPNVLHTFSTYFFTQLVYLIFQIFFVC